jgi:hypothetical protein
MVFDINQVAAQTDRSNQFYLISDRQIQHVRMTKNIEECYFYNK